MPGKHPVKICGLVDVLVITLQLTGVSGARLEERLAINVGDKHGPGDMGSSLRLSIAAAGNFSLSAFFLGFFLALGFAGI